MHEQFPVGGNAMCISCNACTFHT